jgi:WhiB family redox-sensing transcriptional regulator
VADFSHLPGPVLDVWEWQFDGACRESEPSIFFHPDGERGSARRRRAEAAKAVCAICPVMSACREHALRTREAYGVWGGLSEEDRQCLEAGEREPGDVDTPGRPPSRLRRAS